MPINHAWAMALKRPLAWKGVHLRIDELKEDQLYLYVYMTGRAINTPDNALAMELMNTGSSASPPFVSSVLTLRSKHMPAYSLQFVRHLVIGNMDKILLPEALFQVLAPIPLEHLGLTNMVVGIQKGQGHPTCTQLSLDVDVGIDVLSSCLSKQDWPCLKHIHACRDSRIVTDIPFLELKMTFRDCCDGTLLYIKHHVHNLKCLTLEHVGKALLGVLPGPFPRLNSLTLCGGHDDISAWPKAEMPKLTQLDLRYTALPSIDFLTQFRFLTFLSVELNDCLNFNTFCCMMWTNITEWLPLLIDFRLRKGYRDIDNPQLLPCQVDRVPRSSALVVLRVPVVLNPLSMPLVPHRLPRLAVLGVHNTTDVQTLLPHLSTVPWELS
jgi:hypothetical protein